MRLATCATALVALSAVSAPLAAQVWNQGDVFVAVSNGQYQVYDNNGVFKQTINTGFGGFTTGCAFNLAGTELYTTAFSAGRLAVFDNNPPHAVLRSVIASSRNESIVFAGNGDYYVGQPLSATIRRFLGNDTLAQTFAGVTVESATFGTDWVELAANQTTIFYTSENRRILRYDTVAGQMAPFTGFVGQQMFALRLLPPGTGAGGLLVANAGNILRVDGTGAVAQTYDIAGRDSWFALNLDPNGTSFWSADIATASFARFNIASGAIEVGPISTGTGSGTVFGLCVKGEITAGGPTFDDKEEGFDDCTKLAVLTGIRDGIDWSGGHFACYGGSCGACQGPLAFLNWRNVGRFKFTKESILDSFDASTSAADGVLNLRSFDENGNTVEVLGPITLTKSRCDTIETDWKKTACGVEISYSRGPDMALDNIKYRQKKN